MDTRSVIWRATLTALLQASVTELEELANKTATLAHDLAQGAEPHPNRIHELQRLLEQATEGFAYIQETARRARGIRDGYDDLD